MEMILRGNETIHPTETAMTMQAKTWKAEHQFCDDFSTATGENSPRENAILDEARRRGLIVRAWALQMFMTGAAHGMQGRAADYSDHEEYLAGHEFGKGLV
jgi:hypothetical protein